MKVPKRTVIVDVRIILRYVSLFVHVYCFKRIKSCLAINSGKKCRYLCKLIGTYVDAYIILYYII